jgi:hypothetical protein
MLGVVSLEGVVMFVSSTANNGVVNADTRLVFVRRGARVMARYGGGIIRRGYLVGELVDSTLAFKFAQVEACGEIHAGRSLGQVTRGPHQRLRIAEHFKWRTRDGQGVNVFDEVPSD